MPFHVFGGVDLCRDGEVRTHFLADTTDDFQGEACAVFHAAAIGVSTMVGIGGQELVQDVAVCHVHFHGVEASFLGAACCLAELLHQFMDFGDGQGTGGSPISGSLEAETVRMVVVADFARRPLWMSWMEARPPAAWMAAASFFRPGTILSS